MWLKISYPILVWTWLSTVRLMLQQISGLALANPVMSSPVPCAHVTKIHYHHHAHLPI